MHSVSYPVSSWQTSGLLSKQVALTVKRSHLGGCDAVAKVSQVLSGTFLSPTLVIHCFTRLCRAS